MDPPDINAKPRVGPPRDSQSRWIGKVDIDNDGGEQREQDAEPEVPEPDIRVPRVDFPVAVAIPEEHVLLQHRLDLPSRQLGSRTRVALAMSGQVRTWSRIRPSFDSGLPLGAKVDTAKLARATAGLARNSSAPAAWRRCEVTGQAGAV